MMGHEGTADLLARLLGGTATPPRLLFVAAHPDDETLGASWLLRHVRDVHVLHVTDGAPRDARLRSPEAPPTREAYARLREQEALAALGRAGVGPERLSSLGAVDQEAVRAMVPLARRLALLLDTLRPTHLVVHPYEGGHPDHDAAAFISHAAVALRVREGRPPPVLLEMTSYHRRDGMLVTGEFLPGAEWPAALTVALSEEDRTARREMLACFATQSRVLAAFPEGWERYRPAPRYDFTQPPHAGVPHYEALGWELTGARWRELARDALEALELPSLGGARCR